MALTECEKSRRWRVAHPNGNRDKRRKYRANNLLNARESTSKWQKENPENHRINEHIRRTRITKAGGRYTLKEWNELCAKYNFTCLCCTKKTILTPDHIIPVAKGGSSSIRNIQPLCQICNSRKGVADTDFRQSYEQRAALCGRNLVDNALEKSLPTE
jgi:5-methylcytosine-specific restriction endonuclease McrA